MIKIDNGVIVNDIYVPRPSTMAQAVRTQKVKEFGVTENGDYLIVPDEGYGRMNKVDLHVNVQPDLQPLEARIGFDNETGTATFNPEEMGADGFSIVTVDATEYGDRKYMQGQETSRCNLGQLRITGDVYNSYNTYSVLYPRYNENGVWEDGAFAVIVNATDFGNRKYNQGYNDGDITGYQRGFQEGVDSVECPTYTSQDLYLDLNDKLSEEERYMKTINASDYGVDGFSSIEIMGDHFAREMEEKGYERVVNESSVVDITENGSYYSVALERPAYLMYAYIDGQSYDTGLYISDITSIDFWWKFTEDNMPDGNKVILGCLNNGNPLIQNNFNFTFIENTTDITKCSLRFNIWIKSPSYVLSLIHI